MMSLWLTLLSAHYNIPSNLNGFRHVTPKVNPAPDPLDPDVSIRLTQLAHPVQCYLMPTCNLHLILLSLLRPRFYYFLCALSVSTTGWVFNKGGFSSYLQFTAFTNSNSQHCQPKFGSTYFFLSPAETLHRAANQYGISVFCTDFTCKIREYEFGLENTEIELCQFCHLKYCCQNKAYLFWVANQSGFVAFYALEPSNTSLITKTFNLLSSTCSSSMLSCLTSCSCSTGSIHKSFHWEWMGPTRVNRKLSFESGEEQIKGYGKVTQNTEIFSTKYGNNILEVGSPGYIWDSGGIQEGQGEFRRAFN